MPSDDLWRQKSNDISLNIGFVRIKESREQGRKVVWG